MQMSKMYNAGADANANAYLDSTTNLNFHVNHKPNPTLSLQYDCTDHVQPGFLRWGYGINAILLTNAIK